MKLKVASSSPVPVQHSSACESPGDLVAMHVLMCTFRWCLGFYASNKFQVRLMALAVGPPLPASSVLPPTQELHPEREWEFTRYEFHN